MLVVLFLSLLLAQEKPAPQPTISGTVTDAISGTALNKVQVLAEPLPAGSRHVAGTTTDAQGKFTLVNLRPGEYHLKGIRNGYLETYYGARRADAKGIVLTLGPDSESKDLQLKLIPHAVIAGTVRDPDGEPIAGARVALISVHYVNGVRVHRADGEYATTDDQGQYRIAEVHPGAYYVHAGLENRGVTYEDHSVESAPAREILVPTFHPSSRELAGARKLDISPGDRITGADITLLRSRLFRVRVRLEGPVAGVGLHPRPNLSDGLGPDPPSSCAAGICDFFNVPSGAYWAEGQTSPPKTKMTFDEMFSNSTQTYVNVPVDVANADVDNVRVTMTPPAEIAGTVEIQSEEHPEAGRLRIRFVDEQGSEHHARFVDGHTFTALLSLAHYSVHVDPIGDLVATSIQSDHVDVSAEGLTISRSGNIPVEVTLRNEGAKIEGAVKDDDDRPVAGATVVLVPAGKLLNRHNLYQQTESDQLGRYHFQSIIPGDYKLYAWTDVEPDIWFDPDFDRQTDGGRAITLKAKEAATANLHPQAARN